MQAGKHVHLHIVPTDKQQAASVLDAIVVFAFSTSPDVPNHLVDLVFYNEQKPGISVLDQIDFRHGVKHKKHDDVTAGKEMAYFTVPYKDCETTVPETNQHPFAADPVCDEEVYQSVVSQIMNNIPLNPPNGANLQQFIEAINRFANEQKAQLDSAERVDHALEEALDQAEAPAAHPEVKADADPQMRSTSIGTEPPTPTSLAFTTPIPTVPSAPQSEGTTQA